MEVLITGATGLIGKELGKKLIENGHTLRVLTRDTERALANLPFPAKIYPLGLANEDLNPEALIGVDAVINLSGESIGEGRWNNKRKKELYDSRIFTTRKLVRAIKNVHGSSNFKLKHFISASAIGIYGNRGDEELNEESQLGDDFLAGICKDWEIESDYLQDIGVRVVNPRIGIVLSPHGGALQKMMLPFCLGLGGPIGLGKQWMSWIHLKDLVDIFIHLLENSTLVGPFNACAPRPATNYDFSKTLAESLGRPMVFPVPSLMLKILLGEMSTLVLSSQKVSPQKIIKGGFNFKFPDLASALENLCSPFRGSQKELVAEQWIPKHPSEIFPFFSDEKNLEKLTPTFLNFKVLKKSTPAINEGTLIDYRLNIHGLPIKWRTRIEDWRPGTQFVDTQLKGPYRLWHHTHDFIEFAGGTLMRDRVLYKVPLGLLGDLFAGLKVRSDVTKIFSFRRKIIFDLFYRA